MSIETLPKNKTLNLRKAFRHIIVFQIKLVADAFRDFLFSPVSFVAFAIDVLTRPTVEKSLSLRLMRAGRRSDRMINLFGEYSARDKYSIDAKVNEFETVLQKKLKERKEAAEG